MGLPRAAAQLGAPSYFNLIFHRGNVAKILVCKLLPAGLYGERALPPAFKGLRPPYKPQQGCPRPSIHWGFVQLNLKIGHKFPGTSWDEEDLSGAGML